MKEIYIEEELLVWIGENARDNTLMIHNVKKRNEPAVWFHLQSVPSAHIVAFMNFNDIDRTILSQIKSLILKKTKKAPASQKMIYTEIQNVRTSEIPGEAFPKRVRIY